MALLLPRPLQRSVEAFAEGFLSPAGIPPNDFSRPAGKPALVAPDSVSWRLFKNPLTLFVGGVAAVLLELGEPRVRHGVWDHSNFRTDPLDRLQRTGLAAMVTVYGPEGAARAMIGRVNRLHGQVRGRTAGGADYRADDPELLSWVQATAAFGFLEAYAAFVRPVPPAERDAFYAEGAPIAGLYGAVGAPASQAEWDDLLGRTLPRLEPSATLSEFLDIMRSVPALPRAARPVQRLLVRAAIDIVPPPVARQLGLSGRGLGTAQRPLVQAMARFADRLLLRSSPAVQSCLRLGLPEDHLCRTGP